MDQHVHCYLKQSKICQCARKVIELLKFARHKPMKGMLKEKTFFFTCLSCTMVAAMLGNWFLGTALS